MPKINQVAPNASDGIADEEVTIVGGSVTATIPPGSTIGVTDNGGSLTVDGSVSTTITGQPIQVYSTASQTVTITGVVHSITQELNEQGFHNPTHVTFGEENQTDAFSRLRVSQNHVLLSAKHLYDELPISFTAASGVNGSRQWVQDEAAVKLYTTADAGSYFYRQTRKKFPYTAGNSQLIACTFAQFQNQTGIRKRVGYFEENNGIYIESSGGTYYIVTRSHVTGVVTESRIAQADWNIDTFNGSGPSGKTIDFTKAQILFIDFQWLGAGRTRVGFDIDGIFYSAHHFTHANVLSTVYMSTPTLPIRYEIYNTGGVSTGEFHQICSAVMREGGEDIPHYTRTLSTFNSLSATTTTQNAIAIRVNSNYIGTTMIPISFTVNNRGADTIKAELIWNPTFATELTWAQNQTNYQPSLQFSNTQANYTANTGVVMDTIFIASTNQQKASLTTNINTSLISCGIGLDGIQDILALVTTSRAGTLTFDAALSVDLVF